MTKPSEKKPDSPNAAALAKQEKNQRLVTLGQLLEERRETLLQLLPKHLTPDRLMKVALNCVSRVPALMACDVTSIVQCVYTCAELGLEPGGALGLAYLVPFKGVCTLIIGYRGLIRLVRNSGELSTIRAVVVHQKDRFRYREGLEQQIIHEPFLDGDPGPLTYVYAVAKLRDGSHQVEVMSKSQVDSIRARSRSANDGPWVTDYEEQAKKTVVRRISKYLPMTEEAEKAFEVDNEDFIDGEVTAREDVVARAADTAEKRTRRKLGIADVPPTNEDLTPALEASIAAAQVVNSITASPPMSEADKAAALKKEKETGEPGSNG